MHCLITPSLVFRPREEGRVFSSPLAENFYGGKHCTLDKLGPFSNFPYPGLAKYMFFYYSANCISPIEERLCFLTAIKPSTQQTAAGDERPACTSLQTDLYLAGNLDLIGRAYTWTLNIYSHAWWYACNLSTPRVTLII